MKRAEIGCAALVGRLGSRGQDRLQKQAGEGWSPAWVCGSIFARCGLQVDAAAAEKILAVEVLRAMG